MAKSTYGYKMHINCSKEGMVKSLEMTKASVHDSQVFERLIGKKVRYMQIVHIVARKTKSF